MIERPSIIITSIGRTGTKFFSVMFKDIIKDCDSFHEPDIIQYFGTKDRIKPFISRVKDAGIYYMVFLKLLGRWSLIKVSDERLRGKLNDVDAAKELLRHRINFVNSKAGKVYVESNAGYYGLIDTVKSVYAQSRVIYVVRDGREWVSSTMNVGELYGKKGLRKLLSHQMPTAAEFSDDPLSKNWQSTTQFEKLCWAWSKINGYAVSTLEKNPHARLFHFEKIFMGNDKYRHLSDLVEFATSFSNINIGTIGNIEGQLENKIHASSRKKFPTWENWTATQKQQFKEICGPLMEKLNYEIN